MSEPEERFPGLGDLPDDIRGIVSDHIKIYEISETAADIRTRLGAKSGAIDAKLEALFASLSAFPGLNQTLPTEEAIDNDRITDGIDLLLRIVQLENRRHVRFLWKTRGVHRIRNIHTGFTLGDLNFLEEESEYLQVQLPLLEILISKGGEEPESGFFRRRRDTELRIRYRLNRSWIERKEIGSHGELDSGFDSTLDLVDFLTDNYRYPEYGLMVRLINGVHGQVLGYLERKRRELDRLDL